MQEKQEIFKDVYEKMANVMVFFNQVLENNDMNIKDFRRMVNSWLVNTQTELPRMDHITSNKFLHTFTKSENMDLADFKTSVQACQEGLQYASGYTDKIARTYDKDKDFHNYYTLRSTSRLFGGYADMFSFWLKLLERGQIYEILDAMIRREYEIYHTFRVLNDRLMKYEEVIQPFSVETNKDK